MAAGGWLYQTKGQGEGMTAKIQADCDMNVWDANGDTWLVEGTNRPKVFLRRMPEGLFVVLSYVNEGSAEVTTVSDGQVYALWYKHSPITTRQAALLVNRFMKDMQEVSA